MKPILILLVNLLIFTSIARAQNKTKNIYTVLEVYEKNVAPYLAAKISNDTHSTITDDHKAKEIARRLSFSATIKAINYETREEFKNTELTSIKKIESVRDFIEYRYKLYIGGLPNEFFKKVSGELDKL